MVVKYDGFNWGTQSLLLSVIKMGEADLAKYTNEYENDVITREQYYSCVAMIFSKIGGALSTINIKVEGRLDSVAVELANKIKPRFGLKVMRGFDTEETSGHVYMFFEKKDVFVLKYSEE